VDVGSNGVAAGVRRALSEAVMGSSREERDVLRKSCTAAVEKQKEGVNFGVWVGGAMDSCLEDGGDVGEEGGGDGPDHRKPASLTPF